MSEVLHLLAAVMTLEQSKRYYKKEKRSKGAIEL